jgi:hypothetical protein
MIANGTASRAYKDFLPNTPDADPIVRTFNNCYGLFTDTHMSKIDEDNYVITGSLCSIPEKFDQFLYSCNYGLGTTFRVNGKAKSLSCYLSENGLRGQYSCLNGDKVYSLSRSPISIDKSCCYSVCACQEAPQMDIPVQVGEKLKETLSGIIESSGTLDEMQKTVNENELVQGNDWVCFSISDGFAMKSDALGKVVLFESKTVKRYRITDSYSPLYGSGRDREYTQEGTLEELIEAYRYTLETGKSYERERGNKKINLNPKSIQALCDNLQKAKDNAARDGYSGHSYTWEEIEPLVVPKT